MTGKPLRTRNYATIVYPESAPASWLQTLEEQKIPFFVSPLHDSDINEDGTDKKPHYHVMIMYENVKTQEQARAVFDQIGGVGCEIIHSVKFYARYLCHLDQPEKAQYNIDDVRACGKDYAEIINSISDTRKTLKEIHTFLQYSEIHSFAQLADYALEFRPDWYIAISEKYSYFLDKYIKSKAYREKRMI